MSAKMDDLKLNYKIWLETSISKGIMGDKKCELLRTIEETGSLNDAMKKLKLTYRKTWDNLRKIEKELGFPVIKASRGGPTGGSTILTREGKIIIKAFEQFHAEYDKIIQQGFEKIITDLKIKIQ